MREQAKKQPNTWLYVVDPIFTDPSAEVPPWGFIGGYRVDEHGEITDDFSPNPHYRPSPVALRLPAPTNDVERALQLTTTGYAQGHALLTAMLDAELILFAQPQGSGLFTLEHESGRRQLQAFTSEAYLPPNWTTWQRMTGRQLAAGGIAGLDVQVNPTSPIKARIPGEDLLKAAAAVPPKAPQVPMSPPAGAPAANAQPPAPDSAEAPAPAPEPSAPDPAESDFGSRFLGAMLAAAIGDALGAPVEFYPVDQIRSRFGAMGVTEYDRGGEHPGEFTDDTQMALFTLEGLIRGHIAVRRGQADSPLPSVQLAYQRWLHTQGYAWSRAVGPFADQNPEPNGWLVKQSELFTVRSPNSRCITALREFASVGAPGTFERPINDSPDSGGVVRAAPVALWSDDPREVFELAAATAALTYSQPNGYLPAGVLAVLVHRLLRGETLPDALTRARELLVRYRDHEDTDRALHAAQALAQQGKPTPEQLKDALGGGWAGHEALAIAVCAALSTDGVAAAVMVAVNHSGDSDSTAAICGAIVGAQHGAQALPGVWLRDLKQRELVEALAKDALLEFGGKAPDDESWKQRYPAEHDVSGLDFAAPLPPVDAPRPAAEPAPERSEAAAEPAEQPEAAAQEPEAAPEPEPAAQQAAEAAAEPPEAAPEQPEAAPEPSEPAAEQPAAEEPPAPEQSDDAAGEAEAEAEPQDDTVEPAVRQEAPGEDDVREQRVLGFLLGGAVGDALGYPIEDDSLAEIRRKYGPGGLTDFVDAHRPGGSISDDTQMTLFTLDGLIRASIRRRLFGENEPGTQVQHAYQRWLHTQGFDWKDAGGPIASEPPDGWLIRQKGLFVRRAPGTTSIQALHGYASGKARGSFTHRLNDSKGCGGVMRAAPAGLWSDDPAEVFQVGALTAVLTHGHPSGYLPAGALAVIIQQLLAGRSLPEAVDRALTELSTWDDQEETSTALRRAIELAAAGTPTPEQIHERIGEGWFGEQVLAIAVCAALTCPESFTDAVVLAANHSGDSDSTAAICGNIMGAAQTAREIPPNWLERLELREVIEQLARDAFREFSPHPPEGEEWLLRYPVGGEREPQESVHIGHDDEARPEVVEAAEPVTAQQPEDGEPEFPAEEPTAQEPEVPVEPVPEPPAQQEPEPAPQQAAEPAVQHESEPAAPEPAVQQEPETAVQQVPEPAVQRGPESEPAVDETDGDDNLSEEELRLLTAWRKFRDGEEGNADLTQGLHKLLVEAFGEERAAQLLGEAGAETAEKAQLATATPVQLSRHERFEGCVLGSAVGDALGAPWMLSELSVILRENPEGVREFAEAFGRPGAATALTQQTAFVVDGFVRARVGSVLRGDGHLPGAVRLALLHWLRAQGARIPEPQAPVGEYAGHEAVRAQRFPDEASLTALARWASRDQLPTPANPPNDARTPAAAVRGAVLGFAAKTPQDAISLGTEVAAVTHGHPDGYLAAGAAAGLVCALENGLPLADGVQEVLSELDRIEGGETTARGLRAAMDLAGSGPVSPTGLEQLGTGWTAPEALAIAVAAALAHPGSFADAVSLAATHSGNSPATAALCGSLLGAARGLQDVPAAWRDVELGEVLDALVTDAQRAETELTAGEPAPDWARPYLG
ncbi:hypothetical protein GCM10025787_50420 [Saccharopolyspora rosea]